MNLRMIEYNKGKVTCPKCGGMLSYDASMKDRLPMGFGFAPGSATFRVDYIERKGWRGECMECGEKVFAVVSSKAGVKYPVSINRKITAAAAKARAV